MKQASTAIIGSGFASLAAACTLADQGQRVTIFEKNDQIGGRARKFHAQGFTFDMGPSWYWMPDVFEQFFQRFNKTTADYYELKRLNPSYRVFFKDEQVDLPASMSELEALFESREKGAGEQLKAFLKDASVKYKAGMHDLVHKPGLNVLEFAQWNVVKGIFQLDLFKDFRSYAQQYFRDPKLLSIIEFPVLFLGATPQDTPALYSLMNYADLQLGTWYPMGGMHKIIAGITELAKELGVTFNLNEPVERISKNGTMFVQTNQQTIHPDFVVAGADYHHCDTQLLDQPFRQYSDKYWNKRTMAPSSLLFYLGVDQKIDGLQHHNLFFDAPFDAHAAEIYKSKTWPDDPLFYVCCPSKTDASVAPEGKENIFVLIPIAPGLGGDDEGTRQQYLDVVLDRMEHHTGSKIKEHISYQRSYCVSDFKSDYNAFKGNAYGLANTLRQTAILKPRIQNKKLPTLYYTGQLTTPGPGMPPSLISGQVVASQILKSQSNHS